MSEIIVTRQGEWDEIPKEFDGYVYIKSPADTKIVIAKKKGLRVVARGNSQVVAWGNSQVVAWENSQVVAWENSQVEAWGNSQVVARENSQVVAWGNSQVEAWENSQVEAWGNSQVVAWGNSQVVARENSQVEARGNSQVVAWENSQVEAWENSQVEAWENSQVEARGNSQVEAWENVQVVQYSDLVNITIQNNARIITLPKTPEEYCNYFGNSYKDGVVTLYKAVKLDGTAFCDSSFKYEVGETKKHDCDPSVDRQCSQGMHVSNLHWAIDFGRERSKFKIIECAVPLEKIIVPKNTDGKVRTSELTVLREVPPEEWGLYGKFLKARGEV